MDNHVVPQTLILVSRELGNAVHPRDHDGSDIGEVKTYI